jgi:hypothetical protein
MKSREQRQEEVRQRQEDAAAANRVAQGAPAQDAAPSNEGAAAPVAGEYRQQVQSVQEIAEAVNSILKQHAEATQALLESFQAQNGRRFGRMADRLFTLEKLQGIENKEPQNVTLTDDVEDRQPQSTQSNTQTNNEQEGQ